MHDLPCSIAKGSNILRAQAEHIDAMTGVHTRYQITTDDSSKIMDAYLQPTQQQAQVLLTGAPGNAYLGLRIEQPFRQKASGCS